MTTQEHRVSIIIPHHENYEILRECVKSLNQVKYRNTEIIVVDNNSSDQSIQKIQKDYSSLVIHSSKVNLGYAGGCNAGAKIAKVLQTQLLSFGKSRKFHVFLRKIHELREIKNVRLGCQ